MALLEFKRPLFLLGGKGRPCHASALGLFISATRLIKVAVALCCEEVPRHLSLSLSLSAMLFNAW